MLLHQNLFKRNQEDYEFYKTYLIPSSFMIELTLFFHYFYYRYINHLNLFQIYYSTASNGTSMDYPIYKPNLSACFLKPAKLVEDLKKIPDFNHSSYMKYTRCILDHDIIKSENEKKNGLLLIVDSLCPLGIEITHQLRKNQIEHLDIRGNNHLDINNDSGKKILDQFKISKALIVCDSKLSRNFISNFTVSSAIKNIQADVMIEIPPIFGHIRGKHSNDIKEDLYYKCLTKKIDENKDENNNELKFALAIEAAKFILQFLNYSNQRMRSLNLYSYKEIYKRFYSHCIQGKKDELVENLLDSCHPFPPQDDKEKTLSIMTTISLDVKYSKNANQTFYLFEHYLRNYPQNYLPLEIVIVAIDKPQIHIENVITFGESMKKYIRIIRVNQKIYDHILNRMNVNYFPEFVLRNIGIRRSKGEFILSMSSDSFPNKKIFDYVLHRQFNMHSYLRAYSLDMQGHNLIRQLSIVDSDQWFDYFNTSTQYFVSETQSNLFRIQTVSSSSGSFQLLHWRIWKFIHGFIEAKQLFHIDGCLGLDIVAAIPSPTLMKIIGSNFHLTHAKRNYRSIKFPIGEYRIYSRKGFISAETFSHRENWGLSNVKSLPPIEF